MATSAPGTIPPPMSWAERNDKIFLNIDVECKDIDHKVTDTEFQFSGVNALDAKKYQVTLKFKHPVDPNQVTLKNNDRVLEFTIAKKESGPFWKSLVEGSPKLHFLKANFAKWKNESDDEDDDMGDDRNRFNFDMNSIGKDYKGCFLDDFNPDEEDDSDDENIPSLSPNDEDGEENDGGKEKKIETPLP